MNKPVRWITRTGLLLAVAMVIQLMRLPQPYGQIVTGGIINATLVLAVTIVDVWSGLAIGLLTPWLALAAGILGIPFMAPFIMAANITLVLVYGLVKRYSRLFAGVLGALGKYGFFLLTINVLLGVIGKALPQKAVAAFSSVQLGTALIGVFLAFIIADTLKPYLERQNRED